MNDITFPEPLIQAMRKARSIAVMTGAGVSAESNIPTFRDAQTGLWAKFRPEDLATPEAFLANPERVWDWYQWRRELIVDARPNPAHLALARLADLVPELTLITQNVDGLHQAAGSRNVVELHGNISRTKCFEENTLVESWPESKASPPPCPRCGGRLRPDVVWFNESLPSEAIEAAALAAASCDLFFSIGTSALVYPAASFVLEAKHHQAMTVEINPQATPQTRYLDFALAGPAGQVLPRLLDAVWGV